MNAPHQSNPDPRMMDQDLLALADGELDDHGKLRVQQYLATHPEAARQLAAALAMKQHVAQVMQAHVPAAPPALRDQISQLLAAAPQAAMNASASQPRHAASTVSANPLPFPSSATRSFPIWMRWMPAAMAAMVLLTVGLMLAYVPNSTRTIESAFGPASGLNATPPAQLATSLQAPVAYAQLSEPKIKALGKRHNTCSKKLEALYRSQDFPNQLNDMPAAIARCVGKQPKTSLNLSRVGYDFIRAGECHTPGVTSVHMVYQAKAHSSDGNPSANREDAMSLWVMQYDGKPELGQNIVYQGNVTDSDTPLFFWRHDDLVYYLIGNSFEHTREAAQALVLARQRN